MIFKKKEKIILEFFYRYFGQHLFVIAIRRCIPICEHCNLFEINLFCRSCELG